MSQLCETECHQVENELFKDFSLASLGIKPFEKELQNATAAIVATIYAYGRQLEIGMMDTNFRRVCAIGEIIAPNLDPTLSLDKEAASSKVTEVVRRLLSSDNLSKLSKVNSATWQKDCRKGGMLHKYVPTDYTGAKLSCWPKVLPINKNSFIDIEGIDYLTPNRAMAILLWLAFHALSILKYEVLQLLLSMHVALINEGKASRKLLTNIKYLEKKFKVKVSLKRNLFEMLHNNYGKHMNDKLAKKIFSFWITWIDPLLLKAISPEAENNLLSINTIREAFLLHPDFPWEHLTKHDIYAKEILTVQKIIPLVMCNPYIGFNENFRMSKEKDYCNIASVARDIVCFDGERSELKEYPGFVHEVPFQNEVDILMQDYFKGRTIPLTDDIPPDIVGAIKNIKSLILNDKDSKEAETVELSEEDVKKIMKSFFENEEVSYTDFNPMVPVWI